MRLRPRLIPTLVAATTAITCVRLGIWQLHRYGESAELSARMLDAWAAAPLVGLDRSDDPSRAWRQGEVTGRWVPGTLAVVRGTPVAEEPGYQLVTLLEQADGVRVLVDRGWVPTELPDDPAAAWLSAGDVTVSGLVVPIAGSAELRPEPGPGGVARWPLEMDLLWGVFPRALGLPFASMAAVSGPDVAPFALRAGPRFDDESQRRLGPLPVAGYVLPLPQTHHLSYAAQWFGFAGLALLAWAWTSREVS